MQFAWVLGILQNEMSFITKKNCFDLLGIPLKVTLASLRFLMMSLSQKRQPSQTGTNNSGGER